MEPDGYVVLLELEHVGQLLIRQPLDEPQHEQGRVLAVQRRDRAPKLLFQQQGRLDGGMRRRVVVGRLGADRPPAQEVDGRVDGRAPEVGRRPPGGVIVFVPDSRRRNTVCSTSSASAGRPVTRRACGTPPRSAARKPGEAAAWSRLVVLLV